MRPPLVGRRVEQVDDQGQDIRVPIPYALVEGSYRRLIAVHGDHVVRVSCGDDAIPPEIAAQVPHHPRPRPRQGGLNEPLLVLQRLRLVGGTLVLIVHPWGAGLAGPSQSCYRPIQPVDKPEDDGPGDRPPGDSLPLIAPTRKPPL